jgi:hypothetical protein
MLLPDLAAQVTATELERHRAILKVSELTIHTDRSDRDIILAKSWKRADTFAERCKHARPAIVVLGSNQDKILNVCIAKKECEKHWPPLRTAASDTTRAEASEDDAEGSDASASGHEPPEWQKREQERTRWEKEFRPRALRLLAERTTELKWSWPMLRHLLSELDFADSDAEVETSELADLVGALSKMPVKRYPQVLALAFALQRSWSRDSLLEYAGQLGVSIDLNDLWNENSPVEPAVAEPPRRTGRKKSTQAA